MSICKLNKSKKALIWLFSIAFMAMVLIASINHYVTTHPVFNVQGESMMPGILPHNKIIGSSEFILPSRHDIFVIDRNKIDSDELKNDNGPYLKRVVGLPGDTLVFTLCNGELIRINEYIVNFSTAPEYKSFELISKHKESNSAAFLSYAYQFSVNDVSYPIYQTPLNTFKASGTLQSFLGRVFHYPFLSSLPASINGLVKVVIPDGYYFALSDNRVVGIDSRHFGLVPFSSLKYKMMKQYLTQRM